jgi:hypothetical protein
VTYRVAPPRVDDAPPAREEVVELARLPSAIVALFGVLSIATLVGSVLAFGRVGIECERRVPGERGECAIVTRRLAGATRVPVGGVELKMASLGDDTSDREYLAVDRAAGGTGWYSLGARNAEVAAAYRAFVDGKVSRASIPLEDEVAFALGLAVTGLSLAVGLALGQRRVRIGVDMETGTISVAARGFLGGPSHETIATEGFERVTTESEDDSDLERLVPEVGGASRRLATASPGAATVAAAKLDGILRRLWEAKRAAKEAEERADREAHARATAEDDRARGKKRRG